MVIYTGKSSVLFLNLVRQEICFIINFQQTSLHTIWLSAQKQSNGVNCEVFEMQFVDYMLTENKLLTNTSFKNLGMRFPLLHYLVEDMVIEYY